MSKKWNPPDPANTMDPYEAGKLLYKIIKTGERIPKKKYVPLFNAVLHELGLRYRTNPTMQITMDFDHGKCSAYWACPFSIGNASYDIVFDIYDLNCIVTLVNNSRRTFIEAIVYDSGHVERTVGAGYDVSDFVGMRTRVKITVIPKFITMVKAFGDPTSKIAVPYLDDEDKIPEDHRPIPRWKTRFRPEHTSAVSRIFLSEE